MNPDKTSLAHYCRNISRRVAAEFPALTLVLIPYELDKTKEEIETAFQHLPNSLPNQHLKDHALETLPGASTFIGLTQETEKSIIPFLNILSKTKSTAALWLKTEEFETLEDAGLEIYRQLWTILKLQDAIKSENAHGYKHLNHIFTPKVLGLEEAKANMLADAFAAIAMELTGRSDMIKHLAKTRCEMSFNRILDFEAEQHPYPIILDATNLVFAEMKEPAEIPTEKQTPRLPLTYKMTEEIGLTCDDQFISQWQAFIEPAREMLLAGVDIRHILGAAIYTSEDAYNRSIAYLVCDILNTEPAPIANFEGYNTFADIDSQTRNHNKACEREFDDIIRQSENGGDKTLADLCLKTAHTQCWNLLGGNPVGWCAPALIAAAELAQKNAAEAEIQDAFQNTNKDIDWVEVRLLHRGLIDLKKQNKFPTLDSIAELLRQNEDTRHVAIEIKHLKDKFEEE